MAPPSSSTSIPISSILCRFHSPFLSIMNPPFPSNPLFSAFVALYTLILLYFPSFFLNLLLSPLLLSAGILLLSLLRLGAAQNAHLHNRETTTEEPPPPSERSVSPTEDANRRAPDSDPVRTGPFLEWDVGAPLPVIHEAEDEGAVGCDRRLERHPSLSRYYPESDSDSGSDSDSESSCSAEIDEFERSPERGRFRWEEEERDGLIEIKLDSDCVKRKVVDFQFEEDNLIEIDISLPAGGR